MLTNEMCLIIARTCSHVALVLGILALCGLAVLIAQFLREESATGREIDEERGDE